MNHPLFKLAATGYGWVIKGASWLQPVLLLAVRLYWGSQFVMTGMGKLENIAKITGYFRSLGIPFPEVNAYLAGCTECFGGLLLLLGFASRLITVPLIFTMIVAYLTAGRDDFKDIFKDQDAFLKDDAFLFMYAAIIIFVFGPGPLSVDGAIGYWLGKRRGNEAAAA